MSKFDNYLKKISSNEKIQLNEDKQLTKKAKQLMIKRSLEVLEDLRSDLFQIGLKDVGETEVIRGGKSPAHTVNIMISNMQEIVWDTFGTSEDYE